jgi:hypothetical protein
MLSKIETIDSWLSSRGGYTLENGPTRYIVFPGFYGHQGIEGWLLQTLFTTIRFGVLVGWAVGTIPQPKLLTRIARGPVFFKKTVQDWTLIGAAFALAKGVLGLKRERKIPVTELECGEIRAWRRATAAAKARGLALNTLEHVLELTLAFSVVPVEAWFVRIGFLPRFWSALRGMMFGFVCVRSCWLFVAALNSPHRPVEGECSVVNVHKVVLKLLTSGVADVPL